MLPVSAFRKDTSAPLHKSLQFGKKKLQAKGIRFRAKTKHHSCRQPNATPKPISTKVTSAADKAIRLHDIESAGRMIKMVIHVCTVLCLDCL